MKLAYMCGSRKRAFRRPCSLNPVCPFVVGTAPVHSAESPAALFTPVLCTDWEDAVKKLGYSDDWKTYTICEAMYSHFKLFQRQPIIFCNVLDPSTNKEAVAGAEVTLSGKQAKLPFDAILSSLGCQDGIFVRIAACQRHGLCRVLLGRQPYRRDDRGRRSQGRDQAVYQLRQDQDRRHRR